jgi:hypothetical protein
MNIVVIGGHTRNIGKTSVMTGLIADTKRLGWTAVKITQFGHGICSRDGQSCKCAPTEHPFVLTEEYEREKQNDTSRFLAAGARRSLWLRVRQGQLGLAYPLLMNHLGQDHWVMIESNGILGHLKPALYLMVIDGSQLDFKASARQFLDQADAFVTVRAQPDRRRWNGLDLGGSGKAIFPVPAGKYRSVELCRFVRRKLGVEAQAADSLAS